MHHLSCEAARRLIGSSVFTCFFAGSGFSVLISVKELNLSPLLSAVDHSLGNDNAAFGGDAAVVGEFCPYPLPLFYQLSSVLHQVSPQLLSTAVWSVSLRIFEILNRKNRQCGNMKTDRTIDTVASVICRSSAVAVCWIHHNVPTATVHLLWSMFSSTVIIIEAQYRHSATFLHLRNCLTRSAPVMFLVLLGMLDCTVLYKLSFYSYLYICYCLNAL